MSQQTWPEVSRSRETAQQTLALAAKNYQLAKKLARKSCDFDFRFQPPLTNVQPMTLCRVCVNIARNMLAKSRGRSGDFHDEDAACR